MTVLHRNRRGLTLAELVVVLLILVATAGIVVPLFNGVKNDAKYTTTLASMQAIRDAIAVYSLDMKGIDTGLIPGTLPGYANTTGVPNRLRDLVIQPTNTQGQFVQTYNPITRLGWRGPYLSSWTGTFATQGGTPDHSFLPYYVLTTDPAPLDGWGNPIVLQWPVTGDLPLVLSFNVRLVSAGPATLINGQKTYTLDTQSGWLTPAQLLPQYRGNDLVLFLNAPDLYVSNLFPPEGTP